MCMSVPTFHFTKNTQAFKQIRSKKPIQNRKKNEVIYMNMVIFVYDQMPKHEELNSFGSLPQSRYTTIKKDIKKSNMERTPYEE